MADYFKRVALQTPTRFWINNVTRSQAVSAINAGAVGCTQNPAYTWKMLINDEEKEYAKGILSQIIAEEKDDNEALIQLQRALVKNVAEIFMPLYEASNGKQGLVSIQGDPFREDCETIVRCARANCAASPNIIAKIPVTEEGLKAIEILLAEGISINATEVMAVRQAMDVCKIYNKVCSKMQNPPNVYYSHITGIYDQYLQAQEKERKSGVSPDSLWQAGIIIAKKVHRMTKDCAPQVGFIGGGARGLHHFTEMVGADANITINWVGTADKLLELDQPVVQRFFMPTPPAVLDELVEKVPDFCRGYFMNSITPEEYEGFGPVVLFRSSFESAWKNAVQFIHDYRNA